MRQIPLSQDRVVFVDDGDYELLNRHKWFAGKSRGDNKYAARSVASRSEGKSKTATILMHRIILDLQPGDKRECDHIDGDGLNNQRSNLRICTRRQNSRNQKKQKGSTSKYKGIYWNRRECRWMSRIRVDGTLIYLGMFDSEADAALAYNDAATKYFKEFALLNTIKERAIA